MGETLLQVLSIGWQGLVIILDAELFGLIILVLCCLHYTQSGFLKEKGFSFLIFLCAILLIK